MPITLDLPNVLSYIGFSKEPEPVPPPERIDISKAVKWLSDCGAIRQKLDELTPNAIYSLLDKQVEAAAPLIGEAQKLIDGQPCSPLMERIINHLVKRRFAELQQSLNAARAKCVQHAKEKDDDAKLEEKWQRLGLPMLVLEKHADCARFLIDSKLAFAIVGYRETCRDPNLHDLKLDADGHPLIKMQGRWVRWEAINRELHFVKEADKIQSRNYSGNIVQTWNYFHQLGLVPQDRYNYPEIFPVYELSQADYDRVRQHAMKFYETNPEKDIGIPKDCIVQFHTSERSQGMTHPLLQNARRNYPVHIAMRLITPNGQVYSFGAMMINDEMEFVFSDMLSTFLSTVNAKVTMLDYEEFRDYDERIVTSIPLTSVRAQNIKDFLNQIHDKQLRFNYLKQNCSSLMFEIMRRAGYDNVVEMHTSGAAVFYDALPSLRHLPYIGSTIGKVQDCFDAIFQTIKDWTPSLISIPFTWIANILLYIPRKVNTIAINLLVLKMGGSKMTTSLNEGVEEDEFYDKKGLLNFSKVIRSWTDIFKDETASLYHSKYFMDWQRAQRSTFTVAKKDRPKMEIVPPAA